MIKVEQFIVCRVNCQECLRCRDRVKWGQSLTSSHYHSAPHWAGAWCLVADIGALPLEGPGAWHGGTTTGMPLLLNAPITCFLPLPFQLTMDDDSCLGSDCLNQRWDCHTINSEANRAVKLLAVARCRWLGSIQMVEAAPVWPRCAIGGLTCNLQSGRQTKQNRHRLCPSLVQMV